MKKFHYCEETCLLKVREGSHFQFFFARLGARLGAPQRRDFTRRAAQRRVQCTWYAHNVFTEPTGRKCVPARANRRRTRDIAPARLRHAYRVHVKSRPALKRNAMALSTLLRRRFVGLTSIRAQYMGAKLGFCCRSSPSLYILAHIT